MGGCKSIFKKNNGNTQLGVNANCPTCGKFFGKQTTYNTFNFHIDSCLARQLGNNVESNSIVDLNNVNFIESSQKKIQFSESEQDSQDFVWQKVPKNSQQTQFVWEQQKITQIQNINDIKSLNQDKITLRAFQQQQLWFRQQIEQFRIPWTLGADFIKISKDNVLTCSLASIDKVNLQKQTKITIEGDQVNDAGGLLREWMFLIIKQMISPDLKILIKCQTQECNYQINFALDTQEELFTQCYRLIGQIIGKAIFQRIPLNLSFDYTLLKHLVKRKVELQDIQNYDVELFRTWNYLMENEIKAEFEIANFTIEEENHQGQHTIELKPKGTSIIVCDQNKQEYVDLMIEHITHKRVKTFIDLISQGINDVFPVELLQIFEPHEFDMILNGLPFINLQDWMNNTVYNGAYHQNHQVVKWFWDALKQFDQNELAQFLQYCTGSSRTPLQGFSQLQSNRGNFAQFTILNIPLEKKNPFPQAHTCFNRLELPMYTTLEELETYINAIVNNNLEGIFGLD